MWHWNGKHWTIDIKGVNIEDLLKEKEMINCKICGKPIEKYCDKGVLFTPLTAGFNARNIAFICYEGKLSEEYPVHNKCYINLPDKEREDMFVYNMNLISKEIYEGKIKYVSPFEDEEAKHERTCVICGKTDTKDTGLEFINNDFTAELLYHSKLVTEQQLKTNDKLWVHSKCYKEKEEEMIFHQLLFEKRYYENEYEKLKKENDELKKEINKLIMVDNMKGIPEEE